MYLDEALQENMMVLERTLQMHRHGGFKYKFTLHGFWMLVVTTLPYYNEVVAETKSRHI